MKDFLLKFKNSKLPQSIRFKITLAVFSFTFIFVLLSIGLGYFFGYKAIYENIGRNYLSMAEILSFKITETIHEEVLDVESYATRPLWKDAVKQSAAQYQGLSQQELLRRFLELDELWLRQGKDSLLLKPYLENRISESMRDIIDLRGGISELFITDKFGALVASSDKTSDFYQADETWWQEAYNSGKGKVYISDVEFDQSSGQWGIVIAVPIFDSNKKEVIGICKEVFSFEKIIAILKSFRSGRSGQAILINTKGYILYHYKEPMFSKKLFSEQYLKELLSSKNQFLLLNNPPFHKGKIFLAYREVKIPLLSPKGLSWIVFIDQDFAEVFSQLHKFIYLLTLSGFFLILTMLSLGYILVGLFIKPVRRLQEGIRRIASGDLGYKVEINTSDEFGQLASAFNFMADRLSQTTTSIEKLNLEIDARKAAEDKLRQSEVRFRTLYDSSRDAIMILDPDNGFLGVNPAAIELFGYKSESDILAKHPSEVSPPFQPDGAPSSIKAQKMIATALEKGSYFFEWMHRRKDGSDFPATVLLSRMSWQDKVLLQATVRDISEQKALEERLKRDEEELQNIIDSSPAMIFYKDKENRYLRINEAFAKIVNISKQEIEGKTGWDIYPKELADRYWQEDLEVINSGKPKLELGSSMPTTRGILWVQTDKIPYRDSQGNIMGVIGFSLDVTERRLAQERIEAYSKEWAETFDSMSDGVSIHTPAYTIIDVNQALCQLLGKKKQEIIGKRCFEVFHGKDSFPEICPLAHLKNTLKKEYVEFFETNINRWLSVSVSPILNKKNELVKIVHVIRDITERKQLEQMKDDFVSTVSHELRTPLAIMKEGIAQVVEGMHGDVNAKQKKFLGLSLGGIDRLTRIVTNLLDISKIEAGKVQLRLEKVDIVSLARGVGAGFAPAFKGKGIELRYNFAKEKVELYIDKEKIIEVFTNLISNALKFTERGYVEICVSEDIDIVECSVTDTGIGLSEEFLPRVFSKFEQFGKDIGHAERGAGLGLSICKGIIELHKGKIWIESKLGQGTKVSFLLLKEKTV